MFPHKVKKDENDNIIVYSKNYIISGSLPNNISVTSKKGEPYTIELTKDEVVKIHFILTEFMPNLVEFWELLDTYIDNEMWR